MLIPSSAPLPTNSQTPISAARIARSQQKLARIDLAEKRARAAVLGYCNGALSFQGMGLNIMSDVYQTPMVPVPNATSSSTTPASGSGVLNTLPNMAEPAPVVVPIDGSGDGVPDDPQYLPLTVQKVRPPSVVCPGEFQQFFVAPADTAAPWGDGFMQPWNIPAAENPAVSWIKGHPGLAFFGLLLVGAAALGGGKR